ncbi:MAG: GNAT family N-acetyltransferase [Gemmataceae bacterium]|nr:GNAT family N-acetyltransferase [Gemmataceae bacterium]MCS7269540.1 GNAT family N-acetyltransferase [Gemmataceae bacterium]
MRYYKRYLMERALDEETEEEVLLPPGYTWVTWTEGLIERHAIVLYESFLGTIDAQIVVALGSLGGCRELVQRLASWRGFCPAANWLVVSEEEGRDVGCIQSSLDATGCGVIVNVAVVPNHRGRGLGNALLKQTLKGLHRAGARRVYLEVTASNQTAVQLYRRSGFRCYKTLYREMANSASCSQRQG